MSGRPIDGNYADYQSKMNAEGRMWRQSETYPDPAVEVLDPRFLKYRITNAAVERLASGMRFDNVAQCS